MRLAYFGTSPFAVPALEALAPWVELVVTQPSRPAGRGNKLVPTPVGKAAEALGIEIQSPERARDPAFVERIELRTFDALVVASYGQILSERLLNAAERGGINLHASVLPKYRGAAPIARAIFEGEQETGVTIMQMDKGMDTGDIIATEKTPIGPDETAGELEERLALIAAHMAQEWLPRIVDGDYPRQPQDSTGIAPTIAPKLNKDEGNLTFDMDADEAYRRFRAFTPRPGARMVTSRGPLAVKECRLSQESGSPGSILKIGPEGILVGFKAGSLELKTAQPENKRQMSWNDLANGWRLIEGDKI